MTPVQPDQDDFRGYYRLLLAAALGVLLSVLFVIGAFHLRFARAPRPNVRAIPVDEARPAQPLQVDEPADLARLRVRERQQLHSYGIVDRNAGVVHIPIEAAMQRVLERGLPQRSNTPRGAGAGQP
jgi:hypothetical protein